MSESKYKTQIKNLRKNYVRFPLDLKPDVLEAYKAAGLETAGQFIAKLQEGDEAVLALEGVGRKGLADTKKALKRAGFSLPEGTAEAVAEEAAE